MFLNVPVTSRVSVGAVLEPTPTAPTLATAEVSSSPPTPQASPSAPLGAVIQSVPVAVEDKICPAVPAGKSTQSVPS